MRLSKRIHAATQEELHLKAAEAFPPGTAYEVLVVRDTGTTGTRTMFRAQSLPKGSVSKHRTPNLEQPTGTQESAVPQWNATVPREAFHDTPERSTATYLLSDPPTGAFPTVQATSPKLDPELESLLTHAVPPRPPQRTVTTVYVGLLNDTIAAVRRDGHSVCDQAGSLKGGHEGAEVVCYGLGDGEFAARLSEGLTAWPEAEVILVVDSSRKHADTVAWVSEVAKKVRVSGVTVIQGVYTASPWTAEHLGYPLR